VVNLSAVVSKYIGETEKNMEQVFSRAAEKDCILLFDEADALLGRRTKGNDADSNEPNQDLTYWLKRIREYKGIILISCTGRDCGATLGKHKFTGISSSLVH
jgi:SpoVK/Ycf46/Vps4 family AAA+-type ATPase